MATLMRRAAVPALLALLGCRILPAQQGLQIPPPRGMVSDFANVIPADQAARIERITQYVRDRSKGEITIVTLPDIGSRDPGTVALEIGRQWKVGADAKIGDAARNAGTVILVVPKETSTSGHGEIAVTTGQGTEAFITDATAGDIRREATPLLQQRRYGDGLELITLRVAERYAGAFGFSLDSAGSVFRPQPQGERLQVRQQSRGGRSILSWALPVFFVILVLLSASGRGGAGRSGCLWFLLGQALGSAGRGGWGGGGFGGGGGGGGGFGGFGGGGGFSGGGSSGSF
ncbi:MAG TPA: TPM domain-containing protein [Gemmatimonadaceae bacterium]|nr:TPM domain-containing protein [Gemmatimonadaceae bacterium]